MICCVVSTSTYVRSKGPVRTLLPPYVTHFSKILFNMLWFALVSALFGPTLVYSSHHHTRTSPCSGLILVKSSLAHMYVSLRDTYMCARSSLPPATSPVSQVRFAHLFHRFRPGGVLGGGGAPLTRRSRDKCAAFPGEARVVVQFFVPRRLALILPGFDFQHPKMG